MVAMVCQAMVILILVELSRSCRSRQWLGQVPALESAPVVEVPKCQGLGWTNNGPILVDLSRSCRGLQWLRQWPALQSAMVVKLP